jgi:predicted RNase H-like nuclease (RuvC/YqgF family)
VWNEKALSPGMHSIGVIAQDIQKVFPTAVIENADGYLSVDYAVLVSPLIEAVKELDHRNQQMFKIMQEGLSEQNSRRIASLESELTEAKSRVERVEVENQNIKAENLEIKVENQEIKRKRPNNLSITHKFMIRPRVKAFKR